MSVRNNEERLGAAPNEDSPALSQNLQDPFAKNKRCSWHYHVLKDEVFYIQSGKILLKYAL